MPEPKKSSLSNPTAVPPEAAVTAAGVSVDTAGPPTVPAPPRKAGEPERVAHYRIVHKLGEGGMGAVYLADDTRLGRPVALKVLRAGVDADQHSQERFLREARSAAAIKHDHVVTVYDVGEDRGLSYFAMEFLQGMPLDKWLRRNRRPTVSQILRLGRDVANGLAAAHARGLIHRDIKPANLWLEAPKGRVKILDFGLVRPTQTDVNLTRLGAVVGTPAYMAPEQARGATVDFRADLFSLGAVLYRLCTGRPPFLGDTLMAVLTALAVETPPTVRSLNPDVPPDLAELIERLLAKDPAARPSSAEDVAKALKAIDRGPVDPTAGSTTPHSAHDDEPPSVWANLFDSAPTPMPPAPLPTLAPAPPLPTPAEQTRWLHPWVAAAVGAVAALLLVALMVKLTRSDTTVDDRPRVEDGQAIVNGQLPISSSAGPVDPNWVTKVRGLPRSEQANEVAAELQRRNPQFDGKFTAEVSVNGVWRLDLSTDYLSDLRPISALTNLIALYAKGSAAGKGCVNDLTHLEGCRGLVTLCLDRNPNVTDLNPLRGCPLAILSLADTGVSDLRSVAGMPLKRLDCAGTPVRDLAPLRGMSLEELHLARTTVTDFSVLRGMPLDVLDGPALERHAPLLRTIPTLKTINGQVAPAFWKVVNDAAAKANPPAKPFPPANATWVAKVRALAAPDRVKEVEAELKRRNLTFTGTVAATFPPTGGATVTIIGAGCLDLTPVRALADLHTLTVRVTPRTAGLIDLRPLAGLSLHTLVLSGHGTLSDLLPLRGLPLTTFDCRQSKVADLSPLAGMALTSLDCSHTVVADLGPLAGMPLRKIYFYGTKVHDLGPLAGMPLIDVSCEPAKLRTAATMLRAMPTLKTINGKPAAEFWADGTPQE